MMSLVPLCCAISAAVATGVVAGVPGAPAAAQVAFAAAPPADADRAGRKRARGPSRPRASAGRAARETDDRKISLDEEFVVEGKLEKPNAFYILRRSHAGYDWSRLEAKFLPLVLESVQDPLF